MSLAAACRSRGDEGAGSMIPMCDAQESNWARACPAYARDGQDDFPPWRTVYGYFARWRDDGTLRRVHDQLRALARAAAGRDAEPSAAVIDSQSIRAGGHGA
jgi:transposase